MRIQILTLVLFALSGNFVTFSQSETPVSSRVSDVTVFLQGAQVTRKADTNLKAGENILILDGLTAQLDPNSIQVSGKGEFMIMGVKHSINYLQDQKLNPAVQSKKDSLEQVEFKLAMRRSLRNVYAEEKGMILANKVIKGDDSNLLVDDLIEMADFYRDRLKEIEFRILEINQEEAELVELQNKLRNELNGLNARWNRNTSSIEVRVKADKNLSASLEISYLVQQAGWYPVYDLRAKDINSTVDLVYKGKVFQSTGNDWSRVNLTLSTGNPSAGGVPPVLYPWYLQMYDPEAYQADKKGKMRAAEAYAAPQMQEQGVMYDLEEVTISAMPVAVQENAVNTEFAIGIPYDIPSDNKQYEVEVMRPSIKADYRYFAAPRLDTDAFLLARVTDWAQYNLMPGESNIYFQGTFVGKAFIDPAINQDTLNLSMGRDQAVVIKREQMTDFCKTSTIGGKKSTTRAYRIKVTNNKSKPISIQVQDQIPLTSTSEISVEVDEITGGKHDPVTGFVDWEIEVAPGQTKELVLKYTVKYPKKKVISNL